VGAAGEDRAAAWYQAAGYEVVSRNWRSRQGEIDLVLRRGPLVVFCEVKARNTVAFGAPYEAVSRSKQLRLRRLAAEWLRGHGRTMAGPAHEIRFDVASILGGRIEVLEGAF
jgi:putative endonuclease